MDKVMHITPNVIPNICNAKIRLSKLMLLPSTRNFQQFPVEKLKTLKSSPHKIQHEQKKRDKTDLPIKNK